MEGSGSAAQKRTKCFLADNSTRNGSSRRLLRLFRLVRVAKLQRELSLVASRFLSTYAFMAAWQNVCASTAMFNACRWQQNSLSAFMMVW